MFSASLLWIVVLSVELEILFVGLLRHSNNNNNNNNNVHNTIGMNRDDATLVKSGKFKDCVLSWKFGKNVCKLSARILGIGVFLVFSCDPVRCVVTLLRVYVPGCAIGWYCGSSGDNDWMIRICVFCLRQFVALCDAVSAAIMVGRSAFVCSAFVNLSRYGMPCQQR